MEPRNGKNNIRTFALASFLNDMGSDMIYPIWPMFVTSYLNASTSLLGFIDGLGEAIVSLSQALSGYLSDRLQKRKIFIWLGYLFGSLSRVGYAFSASAHHLIPFRILDRAGKIRSAPRDALIADISTRQNRGKHFGILRTMDNLGAVCGILLCILLYKTLGFRNIMLLAALPSAAGAVLIFLFIREPAHIDRPIFKGISFRAFETPLKRFFVLNSVFSLGTFSYSFLLLFAGDHGFRTTFIPLLYLIFTLTASLVSYPFGKWSDTVGRKKVLFLSFLFWGLTCTLLLVRGRFFIPLAFVLYGLHKGAMEPVQKTLVCEMSPEAFRASSLGAFQMVTGLCALPASWMAGILWSTLGATAPFMLSLVLTAISAVLLLFVREPGTPD